MRAVLSMGVHLALIYLYSATFFFQNGVAGNCGQVHQDSDKVVALREFFLITSFCIATLNAFLDNAETDTYANGAHCGKTIKLMDVNSGHTSTGVVADSCPTCTNSQSIDLSQGLFDEFASASEGEFNGM